MNLNLIDNPIVQGIGKIADLIILNLLWIVFSLPIITIGASTTALYSVTLKIVKNEEGYIAKGFIKAFKENFRQSTALWAIFLLAGIILYVDFFSLKLMSSGVAAFFRVLLLIMACLLITAMVYAFGLQARFVNTVKNTLKNAFILLFAELPYTILILIIAIAPVIVTFLTAMTLLIGFTLWIFIGVTLIACLQSLLLRRIFAKLEKPDTPSDEPDDTAEI